MSRFKGVSGILILTYCALVFAKSNSDSSWEKNPPQQIPPSNLADENIRTIPKTKARFVDGAINVCFKEKVKYNKIVSIVKKIDGVVVGQFGLIKNCFAIQVPNSKDGSGVLRAIEKLKLRREIESAEPDYIGQGA